MLLGMICMFCFGILRNFEEFWRKSQKGGKLENLGKNRAITPQRREPTLRHRYMPRHGTPSLRRGQGVKMAPLRYAKA